MIDLEEIVATCASIMIAATCASIMVALLRW
jgi:hypothetical protein